MRIPVGTLALMSAVFFFVRLYPVGANWEIAVVLLVFFNSCTSPLICFCPGRAARTSSELDSVCAAPSLAALEPSMG